MCHLYHPEWIGDIMRVLIISSHYTPEPVIGAIRPSKLAAFLHARGHEVVILSKSGPWEISDGDGPEVLRTPWIRLPVFRYEDGSLKRNDLPIPTAAEQAAGNFKQRLRRLLADWSHEIFSIPDPEGGWIPFGYRAGKKAIEDSGIEVIFATGPSFSSHIIAARLARRFGVSWVADYRDLWTTGEYYMFGRMRKRIDGWIEQRVLANVACVTAIGQGLTNSLSENFPVVSHMVRNGTDEVVLAPLANRRPLSSARLNLLYVGNNFYGGRRTPKLLFRAAREMQLSPIDVKFHFLGSDPSAVDFMAREEGVLDLVEVHPSVGHMESLEWQSRADGLLLLLWDDPRERDTISGKLFEYAAVRRSIILLGYADGEAAQIVHEHRLGWCVSEPEGSTALLSDLLAKKASASLLDDLPKAYGLSREVQHQKLENILVESANNVMKNYNK
ncbi:hypothetical protein OIU93_19760 [Paeniglutamicibacter sp. ZC-3]|uniref:glycosyltransferase n=1 Tax=Paeniglutamicibacter sp. ZC-3 TaxID=2986919 RepID=UPI0021F77D63|nr:glycosyltransferase [Paeniglutamicibacter sp. ZC-3]MCV9996506.1 hypothetical protein [Paeniglutamicibacter sp. ZC-3]